VGVNPTGGINCEVGKLGVPARPICKPMHPILGYLETGGSNPPLAI